MNRFASAAAVTGLVLAGAVATAAPAAADDRTCRGSIGAVSIDGNVIVPSGATCTLNGTRIDGNVEVKGGATLKASGVRVDGNIQSQRHRSVRVTGSTVNGSIQLEQGGAIHLQNNTVDSDIQLFSNTSGRKLVKSNRVEGNLQCKSNTPAPVGGQNVVQGNKEDQCRRL